MINSIEYSHKDRIQVTDNAIIYELIMIDNSRIPAKTMQIKLDTGAFITVLTKKRAEKNRYEIIDGDGCALRGFSEKGLICDLRIIPNVVFCGYLMKNVTIATPRDDNAIVTEVLGMNILENFNIGLNLDKGEIFANLRNDFVSQKPKYSCGEVGIFYEYS